MLMRIWLCSIRGMKEELESKYADNRGLYTKGKKEIIDIILNN